MSSNYYGDLLGQESPQGGWPCCEHCDHDPDYEHIGPCLMCEDSDIDE